MKFQENNDMSSLVENIKYVYLDEDNAIIYRSNDSKDL